jgi:hypothetical protein
VGEELASRKATIEYLDISGRLWKEVRTKRARGDIGDDISTKSSNVKININDVCNLISMSS